MENYLRWKGKLFDHSTYLSKLNIHGSLLEIFIEIFGFMNIFLNNFFFDFFEKMVEVVCVRVFSRALADSQFLAHSVLAS